MVDDGNLISELPETPFKIHCGQVTENTGKDRGCISKIFSQSIWSEIKELFSLAWPTVLSYFFYHFVSMVSLFFAGHLGEIELAAGTLALSYINVTSTSLYIGLGSALETLCAQAFGAKNFHLVGVVLQRGIWILGITSLLTCALWVDTELLLLALHQKQGVARLTQEFVLICLPSLVGSFMFVLLQRYLQAQGIVKPVFYVGAASGVLQIGFNGLFVYVFNLGLRGVAISWALSYTLMSLLLFVYMKVVKLQESTWPGWTVQSLLNWGQFLRLAVSGMVMVCIEFWSFEIGSFLAGSLGEVQLGVFGINFQWLAFIYMIALGISVAAGVRVGSALGAGNSSAAKRTIKIALGLTVCIELVVFSIMFGLGDITGRVFTDNSDVLALYKKNVPLMSSYYVFDGIQGVASGIIRGSGRQKIGMLINFVSYCCLGIPLGVTLLYFVFNEITGLWIGLFCGVVLQACLYCILLWRTDWERQSQLAQKRISAKCVLETSSDSSSNGQCRLQESGVCRKATDPVIAIWIYRSSSLMFLDRVNRPNSRLLCPSLPNVHSKRNGEELLLEEREDKNPSVDVLTASLSPSEKRSLFRRRVIPLGISLLVVVAAVAIRLVIPLPSSQEINRRANGTLFGNNTDNFTSRFDMDLF